MNKIFRLSGLAIFSLAVLIFSTGQTFAQDPCADADAQTALYTKFTGLYSKTDMDSRREAISTAKQFLEKYGACDGLKEQNDYFKTAIPALEKSVKASDDAAAMKALFTRYDAAVNSDNAGEIFAAGKEILAKQPDNVNIMVPMGMIGLPKAYSKDMSAASESVRYAEMALNALNSGKACGRKDKSGAETCGVLKWEGPRADVISNLTYSIAYQKFYATNDKKGAIPLFYKLANGTSIYKSEPAIYAAIGSHYVDESNPIGREIVDLITKQKAAATDDEKVALDNEIKPKVALYNVYMERALDAFGRAHKNTDAVKAKAYKDELYKQIQSLYQRRFEKSDGLDAWLASAIAKPLPDPTTPITAPAVVEAPTTDTATGNGNAVKPLPVADSKPGVAAKPVTPAATKPAPAASKPADKPAKPAAGKPGAA